MAELVRSIWRGDAVEGVPRRDRASCEYEAYLPDRLADRDFRFHGSVAADVADAEAAVRSLDNEARVLSDSEALARLLLRAEAVASSRIEGLEVSARRLLRAEAAVELGEQPGDVSAEEVLGNIEAMRWAIDHLSSVSDVSVDGIIEIHRRLLAGGALDRYAGQVRVRQNWIGGSSFNPCSAEFVPPPPANVGDLLEDLCGFIDDDSLPAVAQAAIAHAQFETIHPFADGNGRVGRALIHVVLRRRGVATAVLPPVSLVLATRADDYVRGLMATRYVGDPASQAAHSGTDRWVELFAASVVRAVRDARRFEEATEELRRRWIATLGAVRRNSAVEKLLQILPSLPIVTANGAAAAIGRSFQATNEAIGRLVTAGVLRPVSVARRNRAFEAAGVLEAFTDLERVLATPTGDTATAEPTRRVPRRRA